MLPLQMGVKNQNQLLPTKNGGGGREKKLPAEVQTKEFQGKKNSSTQMKIIKDTLRFEKKTSNNLVDKVTKNLLLSFFYRPLKIGFETRIPVTDFVSCQSIQTRSRVFQKRHSREAANVNKKWASFYAPRLGCQFENNFSVLQLIASS